MNDEGALARPFVEFPYAGTDHTLIKFYLLSGS